MEQCGKIISAKVIAKDNKNNLTLVIDTECGSCKSSCLMSSVSKKMIIKTDKNYNKGDTVSLVIDEKYMLKQAALLYGLPLAVMFITSLFTNMVFHNDNVTAFSVFFSLIISWVILKCISKKLNKSPVKILDQPVR